jgi:hypothetical protein
MILSASLTNEVMTVTWSSVASIVYGLQYTTDFVNGAWVTLPQSVTATNEQTTQTNFVGDAPQQFYRIVSPPTGP